ncbi:ROK family protein [Meiothermus ruber]|uniref:ROK family protein n=1 Tax=Meiothermus ruber (strain ATCC 35948 / DSM 1279 / VKM B-1258 / 21) TaxID=504728 RepID=A0A806CPT8_MEIRD|nr:ROK family protein [Meiothermus ruber]ADD28032.1 ROK family protein [Meiothermus ruber DSM 1279]MCL6531348.1 ROK family protein [Meiothermus ruber]GAO74978.1 ROK family protein [Meiothermus ruber H328]
MVDFSDTNVVNPPGSTPKGRGRSKQEPVILVADIGGTKIRVGHIRLVGKVSSKGVSRRIPALREEIKKLSTDLIRTPTPVASLAGLLKAYAAEENLSPQAAVLGVPVSLDRDLDKVLSSPNIPQLEGLTLASELEVQLGYRVYLERDIALLLLGEYRAGAAEGANSVLGVFFGTGVGAAMLFEGRPYRGYSVGLELGHIPIRGEGRVCICGNLDCLEAYACGHTLNALSQQTGIPVPELFVRRHEDPGLDRALHEFVRDQAYAVATAINLLDPAVCVIGGGIPQMEGYPREAFSQTVLEHLRRPYPRTTIRLTWAELDSAAVFHGALAVLEQRRGQGIHSRN